MKFKALSMLVLSGLAVVSTSGLADDRFAKVEMQVQSLGGSVHMMVGSGGNIGVSAGEDGVLIVDDQYAPLAEKIAAALKPLGSDSPKYVINTHYHGDHTGSNAFFSANKDATIFAHDNVRIRLASDDKVSADALPVVTYKDGITFHFNGDTIHVKHLPDGHTDGDSVIWFEAPNVLHAGDLFFKDMFPYIDLGAGGSVVGYIASVTEILGMIDEQTKVIPGHGSLANKADLQRFVDMIRETYEFVQVHKEAGRSEDEVVALGLNDQWDTWAWQFITEERWIRTLYK
ncbi:MBL fold metallo-hydrolase [Alteromonas oceanisediminis]|uniref:MBL fold metallo-hydrolase n=1 Tax=Alteromonas oceanisediminis TaxID=2836180 RepID=UPI001BDA20E5|nr:MBL fold metallo-hydrolase [Alteromonas oceanisediminis]MBT0585895.1 MBL fold metallo-hydrolase [Alteromonas oceanisediminis]